MKFLRYLVIFLVILFGGYQFGYADFSDVEYSFYKTEIQHFEENGFIQGYPDGSFRPNDTISREEVLKMVFQASGTPIDATLTNCFPDVGGDMWSEKYICTGVQLGIVKGFEDGTFRPYDNVTTIEAIAFGMRSFKLQFPQDERLWYEVYRDFLDTYSIFPKYNYTPATLITRGQTIQLFERIQLYQKEQPLNYLSQGCYISTSPNEENFLTIRGKKRNYIVKIPSGYDANTPYPLIFGIHGRTNSNLQVASYMKLERYPGGAIVVYPAGLGSGLYSWGEAENIDFFDALVDHISQNYCIASDEIFVVGHSLGGYFTYKLAALRGDVIRGISVVGGAMYGGDFQTPVATQIIHHPNDTLVLLKDGTAMRDELRKINACDASSSVTKKYGNLSFNAYNCSWSNPVVFSHSYATYDNQPHSWPIAGSESIFTFFAQLLE